MGAFGPVLLILILAYCLFLFFMKVIGAFQKETNSVDEATQRDTDEFNQY